MNGNGYFSNIIVQPVHDLLHLALKTSNSLIFDLLGLLVHPPFPLQTVGWFANLQHPRNIFNRAPTYTSLQRTNNNISSSNKHHQQQIDRIRATTTMTITSMRKSNSTCLILLISRLCLLSIAFTFSLLLLSAVRISTCVRVWTIDMILEQARKFTKTIGYEEMNNQ